MLYLAEINKKFLFKKLLLVKFNKLIYVIISILFKTFNILISLKTLFSFKILLTTSELKLFNDKHLKH